MPPPHLLSLLAWSAQPHITAWLAFYHHLQDQHSRRLAITELQTLLKTSDNPIEKRRTATTLLRALDHKWPTQRRRASVNPDREGGARNPPAPSPWHPIPPSPRYQRGEVSRGSASDGEGGCSPSRQPPTTATPALKSEISNLQLPSPPPPRPCAFSSPPPPSITPSPSHTPTDLARAIVSDLSTGNLLQTAATLAAISTDTLRADADTVIERLEPHLRLPKSAHISPPAYHKPSPPHRHACKLTIANNQRTLTLGFTKPHNAPWLLNSLDTT